MGTSEDTRDDPERGDLSRALTTQATPSPDEGLPTEPGPLGSSLSLFSCDNLPTREPPVSVGSLGRGGMARVSVAIDEPLGREVAVKRLRKEHRGDCAQHGEIVKEARVTGQLQHPNVPPVYSLAAHPMGDPFFTMQVIEGRNLREWLNHSNRAVGSRERIERGLEIVQRVCDAVSFAHSRGVLHRDIKPDNIMVGAHGRVYLMDWGLALDRGSAGAEVGGFGVAGTPGYMAPEQARCETIDERSDIFGVGAVLAEIVSGFHPYGEGTQDLVVAASRGAVALLDHRQLKVPKRLCSIVNRAIAALPADRYQSVEQLNEDIRQFLLGGFDFPRLEFQAGEVIVRQGEAGNAAYMILSGTCRALVQKDGKELALRTMAEGEIFGELALLLEEPRSATVIAESNAQLMVIEKSTIEAHGVLDGWSSVLLKALARRFQQLDKELRTYK